jgi:hypothetical protein
MPLSSCGPAQRESDESIRVINLVNVVSKAVTFNFDCFLRKLIATTNSDVISGATKPFAISWSTVTISPEASTSDLRARAGW